MRGLRMNGKIRSIRRIDREHPQFDVLDLYDSLGRTKNYEIGRNADNASFLQFVSELLNKPYPSAVVYGRRTDAMFAYVAASLGNCLLIKKEDSGDVFSDEMEITIPDYRVVLRDGRQFLVEVKNIHNKNIDHVFALKEDYLLKLKNYSRIVNTDLYFAIFWSCWQMWTLIKLSDFTMCEGKIEITFEEALKKNKMSLLRDFIVATQAPLSIRAYPDYEKPHIVDHENYAEIVISDVEMYCQDRLITSDEERRIAFALMAFGGWSESVEAYIMNESSKEIEYVEFMVKPLEYEELNEPYMVGPLSTIISRQYGYFTAPDGKIKSLTPHISEQEFGFIIPKDYRGECLPIWRFYQAP